MIKQKYKVLVFPCGSEIGLEIHNSVATSIHFELFGLNSTPDHGKFIYSNYIEDVGFYTDNDFIEKLNVIIEKYNIDIIYPTMDSVISFLKNNEQLINAKIVGSCKETANICESKAITYEILKNKIKCPIIYNKTLEEDLPLFIKPIIGYGSRNSFKITSINQLDHLDLSKHIITEYLPGKEFTIDCFTGFNRELLFVGSRERSRTMNGISVNTKTDKELTNKFIEIAKLINENVNFTGAWFFQMKNDINGVPKLLEIACRFAGSSAVHRIQGVNFALSSLYLTIGINSKFIVNNFNVEMDRSIKSIYKLDIFYDTIFFDLDDTIIIDQKINLNAISLIFQCKNNGVKIILITKHNDNLKKTLKKFNLNQLFDDVIHISKNDDKTEFIKKRKYTNSIFIDDSFSERQNVHNKLNIPVFGIDCINSLIN